MHRSEPSKHACFSRAGSCASTYSWYDDFREWSIPGTHRPRPVSRHVPKSDRCGVQSITCDVPTITDARFAVIQQPEWTTLLPARLLDHRGQSSCPQSAAGNGLVNSNDV